jgi:uncharacterized surface anchored protein
MTRTDVMASSRPRTAGAAPSRRGPTRTRRGLRVLPVLLMMAFVLATPVAAMAATETTSGYGQTPSTPTTSTPTPGTPTTSTPTTGTSPTTEEKGAPATKETEPAKSTSTPTTSPEKKASTLPFTGFDLRWTVAIGLLLMGAGFSIVAVQRRGRRGGSR